MKALIIGISGFIGKFLAKKLIDSGYKVAGVDIDPCSFQKTLASFTLADIFDREVLVKAAKDSKLIINLAAAHHDFGITKEDFFKVNVKGTENILRCAAELGIKKFVFYSTVAVYGDNKDYSNENTLTNPVNPYGESKLAAEKTISEWVAQDNSREALIIRPTVVFGPGNYANMYNLINNIYKKRFIFVGKGENVKSVAYVENLVDATVFLLERLKPGVEIYNYSDSPQLTITQIVKIIINSLSYKPPKFKIPLRPAIIIASIFDLLAKLTGHNFPITANRIKKFNTATLHSSDKIRALGFKPLIELPEGFRKMVEWYLKDRGHP